MQLDKTRIVVRERSVLEIMDLALHVLRTFLVPLSWSLVIGVLPFALLNAWLIGWMAQWNYLFEGIESFPLRYTWVMSLLVFIEAPLATAFVTAYLGQAVFVERPSLRHVVWDVLRMTPRLIWCQLILRGVAIAGLLMLGAGGEEDTYACEVFLVLLACGVALMRALRPFMNEIILLERNPLFARDSNAMTIGRRSSLLHGMVGGDLFVQWLAAAFVGVSLSIIFGYTIYFGLGAITNDFTWGYAMTYIGIPFALWFTAGFLAVVRFLNYLDSRIRQEGWEVELRLRAEAARMASRLS